MVERLGQERPRQVVGQRLALEAGLQQGGRVGKRPALGPLHGQHPLADAFPDYLGRGHVAVAAHHLAELVGAGGLQAKVELQQVGADHGGRERLRLQAPGARNPALHQPRRQGQGLGVVIDPAFDARPQHLHRDLAPIDQHRGMGLGKGGRGHRLAEFGEKVLDGLAELLLHLGAGDRRRERRQLVLQVRKVLGEGGPEDVAAGAEELAELDRHRAKLLQRPRQPLARPALAAAGTREQAQRLRQGPKARRVQKVELAGQQGVVADQRPGPRRGAGRRRQVRSYG